MTVIKKPLSPSGLTAVCAALVLALSGCSDSSGPSNLDSSAALRSLVLGLGALSESPGAPTLDASFGGIAPLLDQVQVTIDDKPQSMFALAIRESFPSGTCEEDIFIFSPTLPESGQCTPPPQGVIVILWQSHSASRPPDRLIAMIGDVGISNFDFLASIGSTSDVLPATAIYMEGEDDVWFSLSGTLMSEVKATNQPCSLPLPPYAKAAKCSIATFDEHGSIVFEPLDEFSTIPSTKRLRLEIPQQVIHGLWQEITETKPVPLTAFNRTSRFLQRF